MRANHTRAIDAARKALSAALALLDAVEADEPEAAAVDPVVDAAVYFAGAMTRRRAYALARSGAFPASKRGRAWLARRSDLDAWALRQESADEPEVPALARWRARKAVGE